MDSGWWSVSNFTIGDKSDYIPEETGPKPEAGSTNQSLDTNEFLLVRCATQNTLLGKSKE
jgi:hypothetical protein